MSILITTDSTRLVAAFEAKVDAELAGHVGVVLASQPHVIPDYATYRYEAGLIRGLEEAKAMLQEAIKDLAAPERKETT